MFAPGAIEIRPSRGDIEDDPLKFYPLVEHLRQHYGLTNKMLAVMTGDTSKNPDVTIHRKIKNESFTQVEVEMALHHIFEEEGKMSMFADRAKHKLSKSEEAVYFNFLAFAHIQKTSQDKTRARLQGTYRFWRQSVNYADEYIFGKIEFAEDASHALTATMIQKKQPTPGDDGAKETFKGHVYRVSHKYMMILRDLATDDIRVTFFTEPKEAEIGVPLNAKSPFKGPVKHAVWLDGYVLGFDSGRPFFTPLHLALVDNVEELATLEDKLDIIAEDDPRLPPRVRKKLERMGQLRRL